MTPRITRPAGPLGERRRRRDLTGSALAACVMSASTVVHAADAATHAPLYALDGPTVQRAQPTFGAERETPSRPLAPPATLSLPATERPAAGINPLPAAMPGSAAGSTMRSLGPAPLPPPPKAPLQKRFEAQDTEALAGKGAPLAPTKAAVQAQLAKLSGPAKTIKLGARTLDLAAIGVIGTREGARSAPAPGFPPPSPAPLAPSTTTDVSKSGALEPVSRVSGGALQVSPGNSFSSTKCLDKGPPKISEITGRLSAAGSSATVVGRCFGERGGRVDVTGQFGKVQAMVTSWEMNFLTVHLPPGIRGAPDHGVTVTVTTTAGQVSPPMPAGFIAQRERVDVPAALWSPDSRVLDDWSAHNVGVRVDVDAFIQRTGLYSDPKVNLGPSQPNNYPDLFLKFRPMTLWRPTPTRRFKLEVNRVCALDEVFGTTQTGRIRQIRGWEAGPVYQASIDVEADQRCVRSWTNDYQVHFDCKMSYQMKATAWCPAGVTIDPGPSRTAGR